MLPVPLPSKVHLPWMKSPLSSSVWGPSSTFVGYGAFHLSGW
jgi:hypothetical protein